jgi:hypothetical protein
MMILEPVQTSALPPILLKNSTLAADEKILAPQVRMNKNTLLNQNQFFPIGADVIQICLPSYLPPRVPRCLPLDDRVASQVTGVTVLEMGMTFAPAQALNVPLLPK